MANSFSPSILLESLKAFVTPAFWGALVAGFLLFVARELVQWPILPLELMTLWQLVRFLGGIALGFFLISAHQVWLRIILSFLPGAQEDDTLAVNTLRSPVMFLILPVVIFLLVLTPQYWVGLGALWAIASWYAFEAWQLLQNQPELRQVYFPRLEQVQQDAVYHVVLWVYLVIWAGFSFVLVVR